MDLNSTLPGKVMLEKMALKLLKSIIQAYFYAIYISFFCKSSFSNPMEINCEREMKVVVGVNCDVMFFICQDIWRLLKVAFLRFSHLEAS